MPALTALLSSTSRHVVITWLLCWLVLAHLVFGAVAAGALAAPLANDAQFCSGQMDVGPDGDSAGHGGVHCILCPLAGGTPPLPEPQGILLPPDLAFGRDIAPPRVAERAPPQPPLHRQARPRAPPASA